MLGTDYPFPLGESHAGKLIDGSSLSAQQKAKLLGDNALEFFNVPRDRFV